MLNRIVRQRNRRLAVASLALAGLAMAVTFQNCGKVGSSQTFTSGGDFASGKGDGGGSESVITVTPIAAQTANLGTQLQIPIAVGVPANYSGTLKLEVQTPELALLDPGKGIKFSFDKPTLALSGQGGASATLTVDVTTMAPSFDLSLFHVRVSDMTRPALVTDVTVPIQVKAIYEVKLLGRQNAGAASPEKWSIPTGSVNGFVSHKGGLTFRFVNMDTVAHRVHSSGGPIPHEGGDMAPAGGVYSLTIPPGTAKTTSQVYCHNHEGGAQVRTFQFNVPPAPAPAPGASGNPNATFTYLNNNVFKTSCVGCHSGGNPPAGVNLSSYANVANYVAKGNASASAIYNAVAPPSPIMPPGGPALSSALVKDLADWIADGALNN